MVSAINLILNLALKLAGFLAIGLPLKVGHQVATIVYIGLSQGYSWANILHLIQQFNNETAYGVDYKFLEGNNGWGMMLPTWSVYAIASQGTEGQAVYRNIYEATLDRFEWDSRNGINGRESNYLDHVQHNGYNPSLVYPSVVKTFDDYKNQALSTLIAIPAVLFGVSRLFKGL